MLEMLTKGRTQEVCPYCFEYFQLKNAPFRCASPPRTCAPEPDAVLASHWEDSRPLGKVIPSKGKFERSVRCGSCKRETRSRLCPTCHSVLPHTMGAARNYIFAVVGAKQAGKSHYLAVLIDRLKRQLGPSLKILLEEMNDETIKRYREEFYNPVFQAGRIIDATSTGTALSAKVRRPLLYSLTFSGKGLFGGESIQDAVVLAFFDTAGEDLNAEDTMSTVNKYIYRSDGILALVDPLQLPAVRVRLGQGVALPTMEAETADILTRITRLVQKGRELNPTDQISIPLAVAFSKIDAVSPLIDEQFQLNAAARHEGGFDRRDFEAINAEMMALLEDWGASDLVHQVRSRYAKHGFFGLTALGCNPHGTNLIPHVLARRVEDPFLWLLAQNGLLKPAKT